MMKDEIKTPANRAVPSAFGDFLCLRFIFHCKLNGFDYAIDVFHASSMMSLAFGEQKSGM